MPETSLSAATASVAQLTDAWASSAADLRSLAEALGEAGWRAPSALPGWTVADVIAHVGWIEHSMLGHRDAPHDPHWAALPHVGSSLSRVTEMPVDLRRTWTRHAVLAEFDDAVGRREAVLRAGPQDLTTPAIDPFGRPKTLDAVLRMRTFDTWVHGQDVRRAVGRPGVRDTLGATVTAGQIAGGLGYVWAKKVHAPGGATLTVRVRPPGVALVRTVVVDEDGRGRVAVEPDSATVTLTMSFDDFVQLGCGRVWPDSSAVEARGRVEVGGDAALADAVLDAFNIAP